MIGKIEKNFFLSFKLISQNVKLNTPINIFSYWKDMRIGVCFILIKMKTF